MGSIPMVHNQNFGFWDFPPSHLCIFYSGYWKRIGAVGLSIYSGPANLTKIDKQRFQCDWGCGMGLVGLSMHPHLALPTPSWNYLHHLFLRHGFHSPSISDPLKGTHLWKKNYRGNIGDCEMRGPFCKTLAPWGGVVVTKTYGHMLWCNDMSFGFVTRTYGCTLWWQTRRWYIMRGKGVGDM